MKILLTSDTHRGFSRNTSRIHEKWAKTIEAIDFDVMILAGDLATAKQRQLEQALKFFRNVAGAKPIAAVLGNHDFWDISKPDLVYQHEQHIQWMNESGIHYLEESGLILDGVQFVGWDGWYDVCPDNSNDFQWMPGWTQGISTDEWMRKRSVHSFQRVIGEMEQAKTDFTPRAVVAVTHFPCVPSLTDQRYSGNPRWFQHIVERANILCMGHSHKRVDDLTLAGVRCFNAGSDYDKPASLVFEV